MSKYEDKFVDKLVINRIERAAGNSSLKKAILSFALLIQNLTILISFVQSVIQPILSVVISTVLPTYLLPFLKTMYSYFEYRFGVTKSYYRYDYTGPTNNFFNQIVDFLSMTAKAIPTFAVTLIVLIVINRLLRNEPFWNELLKYLTVAVSCMIYFGTVKIGILIILISSLLALFQFNNDGIYKLVKYLAYFTIRKDSSNKHPKKLLFEKDIVNSVIAGTWLMLWALIPVLLKIWLGIQPIVSFVTLLVLTISFLIQQKSDNPKRDVGFKLFIYTIAILIIMYNVNLTTVIELIALGFSILFAINRFYDLYKTIVATVETQSFEYYLMERPKELYQKNFISDEILFPTVDSLSVEQVLIQLIIRADLKMADSFSKLLDLVTGSNRFEKYDLILLSLIYEVSLEKDPDLTIRQFLKNLNFDIYNQDYIENQEYLLSEFYDQLNEDETTQGSTV